MKVHQKLLFPAKLIKAQYNETLENIAVIVIFCVHQILALVKSMIRR